MDKSTVNVMLERILEPPWGIEGGHDGRSNAALLRAAAGNERPVTKESNIPLGSGDTVTFRTAGGGGYGAPSERSRALIEEDIRQGYISAEGAAKDYGYQPQALAEQQP
jgi:N-methylhydantoinase B